MPKCKITVLKKTMNRDLAQKYIKNKVGPCSKFKVGDEFITTLEKPKGFCEWAWAELFPYIMTLLAGGNFSKGMFEGWMKSDNALIICCTDGIRPVIFKIERVDD
ncbi:MAG: TIGR04076 family protein [Euryarchaeota archaeon]|nr:TIGR04076 family protein [Euryarchaeota archaeon]